MVDYEIIRTGSKGNAVLLNDDILVDCGVPFKVIQPYLGAITKVCITHRHKDHLNIATLKKLVLYKPSIVFICNMDVFPILRDEVKAKIIHCVSEGKTIVFKNVEICPFECVHDVQTFGYKFNFKEFNEKVFYVTDTGNLDNVVAKDYNLYLIEANYKTNEINNRIKNKEGYKHEWRTLETHLSYEQAMEFLGNNSSVESEYVLLHEHELTDEEKVWNE